MQSWKCIRPVVVKESRLPSWCFEQDDGVYIRIVVYIIYIYIYIYMVPPHPKDLPFLVLYWFFAWFDSNFAHSSDALIFEEGLPCIWIFNDIYKYIYTCIVLKQTQFLYHMLFTCFLGTRKYAYHPGSKK